MTDYAMTSKRVFRAVDGMLGRNAALSYPIPDVVNGIRAERFFVYPTGTVKVRERPFGVITVAMDGGAVLEYVNCRARDYFDSGEHPITEKIDYSLPRKISPKEFRTEQGLINKLYELVRRVAFKEELTDQERKALSVWYVMLENSVPQSLIPFYQAIGKNFYEWVVKYV